MNDILLRADSSYWLMRGLTEAGKAFVKAHSTRLDHNGEVSLGLASYNQVIADAKAAGLTVVQQ